MRKKIFWLGLLILGILVLFAGCTKDNVNPINNKSITIKKPTYVSKTHSINVMAPLWVTNWSQFNNELQNMENAGVNGISVDVWIGKVEQNQGDFNWSQYNREFAAIKNHNMKIIALLDIHTCSNPNINLPSWLWSLGGQDPNYQQLVNGKLISGGQYVSIWGSTAASRIYGANGTDGAYEQFAHAFAQHYGYLANDFENVGVDGGPSGELRYPSYAKNWSYPGIGHIQSQSSLATKDFRNAMIAKYGSLQNINNAWKSSLYNVNQITPPTNGQKFFTYNSTHSQYGKDFINWYNGSLATHGKNVLESVARGFSGTQFSNMPLVIKIAGIHWQMGDSSYPRGAEIAAGELSSNFATGLNSSSSMGQGYDWVFNMAKNVETQTGRKIIVDLTCIELPNNDSYPDYSLASELVFGVGQQAYNYGVQLIGENALAGSLYNWGNRSQAGWWQIDNVLHYSHYSGITLLRIGNLNSGNAYNDLKYIISLYGTK